MGPTYNCTLGESLLFETARADAPGQLFDELLGRCLCLRRNPRERCFVIARSRDQPTINDGEVGMSPPCLLGGLER